MGRFCLFACTGLTDRFRRARVFLQLSKSPQAHPIRKNNVLILEKFLYDEEQKQFSTQKCGKCS